MLNRLQCEPPCIYMVCYGFLCFVFRSCCSITFCKIKCSVWFGSCWRPRTDKSKETYGFWSWRSRRCLTIVRVVLTIHWKKKITKRQTWMIYSEENSRRGSRIKPNNLKTWINSKSGTRNFHWATALSVDILYFTSNWSLVALSTRRLRGSFSVSWSCACVVTFG